MAIKHSTPMYNSALTWKLVKILNLFMLIVKLRGSCIYVKKR
jgi:hypothetical protein